MARTEKVTRLIEIKGDAKGLIKTLKDIDAATKNTARNTAAIQKNTKRMADGFSRAEAKIAKFSRLLKGLGLFYLGQQLFWMGRSVVDFGISIAKANEQLTLMDTRLTRLGGGGATNLSEAAQLADRLGLTLAEAADNVALLAPAFERVGIPFSKVAKFTDDLTKSMRLFGTDARRAQIVTVQLAQALGSGQLAGDELRSLNENAGQLGLQLERAVQSILNTTKTTKELGAESKLTTDVMLRAFDKVFKNLEDDFSKLPDLLTFAANRFQNAWTNAIAAVDRRFGISEFFKDILNAATRQLNASTISLAENLADVKLLPIQDLQRAFEEASVDIAEKTENINAKIEQLGQTKDRRAINSLNKQIANLRKELEELYRTRAITISILYDNATKDTIADIRQFRQEMEDMSEAFVKFTMPQFDMGGASADAYLANLDEMTKKVSQVLGLSERGAANLRKFLPTIAQAAQQAGVSVEGLIAKMKLETGGFLSFANPKSSARGPGQIIESTAEYLSNRYNLDLELIRTGIDGWKENIRASALYIAEKLKEASGDSVEAYARYFLGSGAVNTGGIDQTIGPNNGLTGRQYGNKVWKDQLALMQALGKETWELEARYENLQRAQEKAAQQQEQRERAIQEIRNNAKSELQKYLEKVDELTAYYRAGDITQQEYFANVRSALEPVTAAQTELTRAQREQEEAVLASQRAWTDFMVQFEQNSQFVEKMREGQRILNQQMDLGAITAEEYAARLQELKDALGSVGNQSTAIQEAGQTIQTSFGSWIDSAVEGTFKLRDALAGLAADLAKLAFRNALIQAATGTPFGDFLGLAQGGAFNQLALPQGVYTQPTYFQMPDTGPLKRYARGGLLGEAGPEAVLPLRRTSSGDLGVQGSGTTVNVNNYSGAPVSERRRMIGDQELVEITIGEIEERIMRGGNSTDRAFQHAYSGMRRGR